MINTVPSALRRSIFLLRTSIILPARIRHHLKRSVEASTLVQNVRVVPPPPARGRRIRPAVQRRRPFYGREFFVHASVQVLADQRGVASDFLAAFGDGVFVDRV